MLTYEQAIARIRDLMVENEQTREDFDTITQIDEVLCETEREV
jgi:hypothetical protein